VLKLKALLLFRWLFAMPAAVGEETDDLPRGHSDSWLGPTRKFGAVGVWVALFGLVDVCDEEEEEEKLA